MQHDGEFLRFPLEGRVRVSDEDEIDRKSGKHDRHPDHAVHKLLVDCNETLEKILLQCYTLEKYKLERVCFFMNGNILMGKWGKNSTIR